MARPRLFADMRLSASSTSAACRQTGNSIERTRFLIVTPAVSKPRRYQQNDSLRASNGNLPPTNKRMQFLGEENRVSSFM